MSINVIEKKVELSEEEIDVLGWQVSVSKGVWNRCIAVPKGVKGQTEEGRLHDLLANIRFHLSALAAPRQDRLSSCLGLCVNVVNDNRRDSKRQDGITCPGEEVPIACLASFGEDGSPRLVVLALPEVMLLTAELSR
jgi:hypothetical protein